MRINYNASAMRGVVILNANDQMASESTERLSSGLKINRAKDNPSGYALSRKMKAQLEGLKQAKDNGSDGVNVIATTDGALSEVTDMLQRINELAVKAANGTWENTDRQLMQDEVDELKDEIQRIAETTEFNGQKLLDGTFDLKAYTDTLPVKVRNYSDNVDLDFYNIQVKDITNGVLQYTAEDDLDYGKATSTGKLADLQVLVHKRNEDGTDGDEITATVSKINGNLVTIVGDKGFEMTLEMGKAADGSQYDGASQIVVDVTRDGGMTLQVGANEGQSLEVRINSINLRDLGLKDLTVVDPDHVQNALDGLDTSETDGTFAREAIDLVAEAISQISAIRSKLGAYQNRLESTISTVDVTSENMTGALSTITDVDMAEEYAEYSTYNVLVQATTSVLAQANERPSQVLQLLQ